jgi:CcmD family protein
MPQTAPQLPALDTLAETGVGGAISTQEATDPYEEVWAQSEIPTAEPLGLERYMVQQDKLYVVVAVVLLIWFGLLLFLFRTDRRLARLERDLDAAGPAPDVSP